MISRICKIIYFDDSSATDYLQIIEGGSLEKTEELLNQSTSSLEGDVGVSVNGGMNGLFAKLLGWHASGEANSSIQYNKLIEAIR